MEVGGWAVRVVATNADYFSAIGFDGCHVFGQIDRCSQKRERSPRRREMRRG